MSTRSNIIVEDEKNRIQLYRHYNGAPYGEWGVLATLENALPYAWHLPRYEACEFAAALVRAWKEEGGGDIYIDGSPKGWELVNEWADWVYVIKPHKETKPNPDRIDFRLSDPMIYVYDWNLGNMQLNKANPQPVLKVKLSEARQTAFEWEHKA